MVTVDDDLNGAPVVSAIVSSSEDGQCEGIAALPHELGYEEQHGGVRLLTVRQLRPGNSSHLLQIAALVDLHTHTDRQTRRRPDLERFIGSKAIEVCISTGEFQFSWFTSSQYDLSIHRSRD